MPNLKTSDGLTVRISTNARDKTTTILAYRKGRSKKCYKAVLPMCDKIFCRNRTPHKRKVGGCTYNSLYHPFDVDILVKKLVKSYC